VGGEVTRRATVSAILPVHNDETVSVRMPTRVAEIPFNDLKRHASLVASRVAEVSRRVIESGWYSLGPETEAFEAAFAEMCGVSACVAVGNGTDALEIGLRSLACTAGDEVIVTANAGMYAATACVAIGATPVFADVDLATLLMSVPSAAALVGPKTRAVVATHLYGNVVDVAALRKALPPSVKVLEDGAQAHGAALRGQPVGSLGDAAAFSFYPTKNLGALGDAGALVCRDPEVERRARALRQYGWESRYVAGLSGGRNSRIDELQAAILCELMPDLGARNERRRAIWERYEQALAGRTPFVDMSRAGVDAAPHLCVVRAEHRDRLGADLLRAGVSTAVHYPVPDHEQPALSGVAFRHAGLPETERACREVLSLPCFPELRDDEVARVISEVHRFT
jgi:aminotransferase EvaB